MEGIISLVSMAVIVAGLQALLGWDGSIFSSEARHSK